MAPAKQAKVIQDFQKQSAQMDMMVRMIIPSGYSNKTLDWSLAWFELLLDFIFLRNDHIKPFKH